jgi:hypothetical protein
LFFLSVPPLRGLCDCGSGRGEEPSGGECPPPDSDPFNDVEFWKNLVRMSRQFAASLNHRFEFQKRSQLFIRAHNALIRVYDAAGNVIETHEHKGDFKEW